MKINSNFANLKENYLFRLIDEKIERFRLKNPKKKIINLGIGDVTLPICRCATNAAVDAAREMGNAGSFKGYSPNGGYDFLRAAIRKDYLERGINFAPNEIFISDGAKCDISNILDIFSEDNVCLIPNPVYPVYVDTNIMAGRKIIYANAIEDSEFLPLPDSDHADIIYICSPNNPTGAVYTKQMLKIWIDYANSQDAVILFDAAYESFISDKNLPHSIFEIPESRTCAVEIKSFSKTAGFTGMRCGYTIVPHDLKREGVSLNKLWNRRHSTKFNGVSYIIQRAAAATISYEGRKQCEKAINYYKENAEIISKALKNMNIKFFGGKNAPYIWMKCPGGKSSWDFFDFLLENAGVIGVPGAGFGKNGENYFRFTSFGEKSSITEAMKRIVENL
jgi:LL-diaminopimelate aminotransferase